MLRTDAIDTKGTFIKFLNVLPQLAWTADPSGQVAFYNQKWYSYTGLAETQTNKDAWKNIIHPEDLPGFEKKYGTAVQTGNFFTTECRYKRADNHYRWHFIRASAIRNDQDDIYLWVVISTDINDRKRSKEELQDVEYRYRTLIEESSVATALYAGIELKIQYANDIMLGYWGKNDTVIGKTLAEAIPELVGQPFLGILKEVYTTGEPYVATEDKADLMVNGVLRSSYFNFTFKALRDKEGNIYGIHHMAIDVTNQVKARKKIQENEVRFRLMVQQAPVAMLVFRGENMIFETVNDEMLLLVGRDKSIIGKPALEAMPELEAQPVWQTVKDVYRTGEPYFGNEVPVQIVKNGKTEQGYYTFSYVPLKEHNKTVGILHVAIDVTTQVKARMAAEETTRRIETAVAERTKELAEANSNLQRSNAELAQFAYIASHDLQEPLRKISTFSQMLEHSLGNINEVSKNYLDKINSSTSRMAKLIKDVLGYSQLANSEEVLEMVDLQHTMESVKTDYELLIEQKHAIISCSDLPVIQGISLQMSQLFGNLLSNSLKYSSTTEKPVITISASLLPQEEVCHYFSPALETDYYKIEFKDNGIGFKQEYADRIFNIFQRLHGKMEFGGTGIGLAMCQKIVQNHHGKISAKGKPGNGSTFIILLPSKQK
jgi:PAS domain S-box-containing protein